MDRLYKVSPLVWRPIKVGPIVYRPIKVGPTVFMPLGTSLRRYIAYVASDILAEKLGIFA